MSGFVGLWP